MFVGRRRRLRRRRRRSLVRSNRGVTETWKEARANS